MEAQLCVWVFEPKPEPIPPPNRASQLTWLQNLIFRRWGSKPKFCQKIIFLRNNEILAGGVAAVTVTGVIVVVVVVDDIDAGTVGKFWKRRRGCDPFWMQMSKIEQVSVKPEVVGPIRQKIVHLQYVTKA